MPIYSDEPTTIDHLGREVFTRSLVKIALTSNTPIVIGIHGGWGSGKTSLMMQIKYMLENKERRMKLIANQKDIKIKTVWFNPWQHQFEKALIIPLLHEVRRAASTISKAKFESLKLFKVIGKTGGEAVLRSITRGALEMKDFSNYSETEKRKFYQVKTVSENIQEHFRKAVNALVGKDGRLIFFIDDLDRCLPEVATRVLEALKLFLNTNNCVYFLGLDKDIVDRSIAEHYKGLGIEGSDYLEKIIQLPFEIPAIAEDRIEEYISFLSDDKELGSYLPLLVWGVDRNPRTTKRYLNVLFLLNSIAKDINLENYQLWVLIKLLTIQLKFKDLYVCLFEEPEMIINLERYFSGLEIHDHQIKNKNIFERYKNNDYLREFFKLAGQPIFMNIEDINIREYLYLTRFAKVKPENEVDMKSFMKPMKPSKELATIIGEELQTRTEITKRLWSYIKKHGLQDKVDKTIINPDEKLKRVLGGEKSVSMFELTKYLSKHIS